MAETEPDTFACLPASADNLWIRDASYDEWNAENSPYSALTSHYVRFNFINAYLCRISSFPLCQEKQKLLNDKKCKCFLKLLQVDLVIFAKYWKEIVNQKITASVKCGRIRKYIFFTSLENLRRHISRCKFIILRMWVDWKYASYLEEKSLAAAGNWPVSKNVTDLSTTPERDGENNRVYVDPFEIEFKILGNTLYPSLLTLDMNSSMPRPTIDNPLCLLKDRSGVYIRVSQRLFPWV